MRELQRIVASGELGTLLHLEGHNSNENSNQVAGGWRTLPAESPGGGMTGAGLHVLDALVALAGPVRRAPAQLLGHKALERKPPSAPQGSGSAMPEVRSGASGPPAPGRAAPFFWRGAPL